MELMLTPGPVMLPKEVVTALANSNIHHRTAEFEKIFGETLDLYQQLVNSECRPIFLACTGTGGMEAALRNVSNTADKVLVLAAGKFAERWIELGQILKLNVVVLNQAWGQTFDQAELEKFMEANLDAKIVCCQYCETSTCALHNIAEISQSTKKYLPNAYLLVDAITAVGALAIDQQELQIDILVAGSQKALMLPPGLAIVSFNTRTLERFGTIVKSSLYFDLLQEYKNQQKNTTAFTAAISHVFGLNAALKLMNQEGLSNVYARHASVAKYLRTQLSELGFKLLADACYSPSVTGAYPPNILNADDIRATLLSKFSIRIAEGQDQLKGKIIRIGHMGIVNMVHAQQLVDALKTILTS